MNPRTLLKAYRMAVVLALDGTYRVAGDTDVYTVALTPFLDAYACDCRAGSTACSHILAVKMLIQRNSHEQKAQTHAR